MENITVNLEGLTMEERTTLMKLVEKGNKPVPKVWRPAYGEEYYTITGRGELFDTHCYIYDIEWNDKPKKETVLRHSIGNCFKTKEEAEFALERLKVIAELERYALEHNEEPIVWYTSKLNYHLIYNYNIRELDCYGSSNYNRACTHFSSAKVAMDAVKAIGEERLKKYYFRIKEE